MTSTATNYDFVNVLLYVRDLKRIFMQISKLESKYL